MTNPAHGHLRTLPGIATPLDYLRRAASERPGAIAVVDESLTLTYAELADLSERAGTAILALRSRRCPDDPRGGNHARRPVVLLMEKGAGMLAAMLGTLMAGGFYVPIDPATPPERLASMLETLGSAGERPLVIEHDVCPALLEALRDVPTLALGDLFAREADRAALARAMSGIVDSDPAYVLFTSGSTGTPKGVAVSHRAVRGFIDGFVGTFGIRADDVLGNQAPFDFDVSVKDVYGALAAGATLVILPRRLFSAPAELVRVLRDRNVTVMVWAAAALCLVSGLRALEDVSLPSVRLVLFSGEVMPMAHLERWMERVPDATFVNLYGPTEICCNCLYHVVDRTRTYPGNLPLGTALPNRRVLVLDESGTRIASPGSEGELYVGGSGIALGYYGDPERTARAFVANPLSEALGETLYRTGDLVRVSEDGELFFAGRADNQIKHLGHRIELEEIDAAFEGEKGVTRCRCAYDTSRKRIYAFVEGTPDEAALRDAIVRRLPVPMQPARVVRVDSMPLTKNGKVDRRALLASVTRGESHV